VWAVALSFKQIAARLTGFSTPIFGVSWTPPQADRDVAAKIITFLEDRRALYEPPERDISEHLITSILRTREFLTDVLGSGGIAAELSEPVREMRKACREFLDSARIRPAETDRLVVADDTGNERRYIGPAGTQALIALRETFGIQVGLIAVRYGLSVEEQFADLIPPSP